MLKTSVFVPFPDAFNTDFVLSGTKIAAQTVDLYERPNDKLGTNYISFPITQKQLFLGMTNRQVHLDFYRKRFSIRGSFEGSVFEIRGNNIKSYAIDDNDKFLVRISFTTNVDPQEFWMDSTENIKKLFEALTEFKECCKPKEQ
jgi:hypothetical protein